MRTHEASTEPCDCSVLLPCLFSFISSPLLPLFFFFMVEFVVVVLLLFCVFCFCCSCLVDATRRF